jgi:4-amino-4-deoxy-L-arabinose transferase-like glycosyltransferase
VQGSQATKPLATTWLADARAVLLLILATSFVGKTAVRLFMSRGTDYWSSGYAHFFMIAENILHEGQLCLGNPQIPASCSYAGRPPLYPLLIAAVCKLTNYSAPAFIVVEALISTICAAMVFGATRAIASSRAALYAAALAAFFPYSFFHDTQLQETGLYTCLSMAAVFALVVALKRARLSLFLLTGLLLGAALLTRLSHLLPIAALVLFTLLQKPRGFAVRSSAILCLGAVILLMPWVLRNRIATGHWSIGSQSGLELACAHNAHTFDFFPYKGSIDLSNAAFFKSLTPEQFAELSPRGSDEFMRGSRYRAFALAYLREHKLEALGRGSFKVGVAFAGIMSPPDGRLKDWTYFISYWALMLLALCGVRPLWGSSYLWILALICACHALSAFIFWAHTSHGAFLHPLFAVVAGVGLERLRHPASEVR